jgi:hypothetical protein
MDETSEPLGGLAEMDPFNITTSLQKKGLAAGVTHWICAHAAYEHVRYRHLQPDQRLNVITPRGQIAVTKEEMLMLATYPSEIAVSGDGSTWYSPILSCH